MPRNGGTLGLFPPMRRLPRHAGQLGAPYMAGMASGYASRSRKPVILARGSEGSTPSPVASRAQPRHPFPSFFLFYPGGHPARAIQRRRLSVGRPALTRERLVRFQPPLPAALCGAVSSLFCLSLVVVKVWAFPPRLSLPHPGR